MIIGRTSVHHVRLFFLLRELIVRRRSAIRRRLVMWVVECRGRRRCWARMEHPPVRVSKRDCDLSEADLERRGRLVCHTLALRAVDASSRDCLLASRDGEGERRERERQWPFSLFDCYMMQVLLFFLCPYFVVCCKRPSASWSLVLRGGGRWWCLVREKRDAQPCLSLGI